MTSDTNYVNNPAYARQMPTVTYMKPLLVMRTERGELALLDGRQRAFKAFSVGTATVEAYVVTLNEALEYGLDPLAGEFAQVCHEFLGSAEWPDIRDMLLELGELRVHKPVISLLKKRAEQNGRSDLARRLNRLLTLDNEGHVQLAEHRLLKATRPDPIVYGGERHRSRFEHRFPIEVASAEPVKRPSSTSETARLDNFFGLFCIELILTEQFIADWVKSSSPDFVAIRHRFGGKRREDLEREGQTYLQKLWREMGFQYVQIDQFHVLLQYAGKILSATGTGFAGLIEYRRKLDSELQLIMQQKDGDDAIRDVHQRKLRIVKIFCKAHIRARQWSSIQHKLRNLEQDFKSPKNEPRPLLAFADAVHGTHEVDPDLDKTALDEAESL